MSHHAMPDHTIRIYTPEAGLSTEEAGLQAEDAALRDALQDALQNAPAFLSAAPGGGEPAATLAQFCAFVDFYTRRAVDPFSTSLACEKQAEGVALRAEDATSENLRLLMDTLLETIDHLEKKWLDEQLKLEERQRLHRVDVARLSADVARLSARIRELQPTPKAPWLLRSVRAMQQAFGGKAARPPALSKRRPAQAAA